MKYIEAKLNRTSNNIEQLHENQEELASAYNAKERSETISRVPSAITMANGTTISAETVGKMVADGMALAIKDLRSEFTTTATTTKIKATPDDKRTPHDKVWKQWKYWCLSCSTNVSNRRNILYVLLFV